MTETILIVGHGSRNPAGNREIEEFAHLFRERHPEQRVRLCFIEFAEILLDAGLDAAAAESERVIVLPLILNAAGHVKAEIPHHLALARVRHPDTEFIYAAHLGACEPILCVVGRRLRQVMKALDFPDPKTTGVILLARGSSDPLANGEVAKMARWLQEMGEHELVDIAFTGVTHPRLELVAQRQVKLGMTQVAVLPYYLFNGVLIERIQRQVEHLKRAHGSVRFDVGKYIGFEDEIFDLVQRRGLDAAREETKLTPLDSQREPKVRVAPPSGNQEPHHHHHESVEAR